MHSKGFPHVTANFSVAIAATKKKKKKKDNENTKKENPIAASMNLFKSFCLELDKLCRLYRQTTTRTRSTIFFPFSTVRPAHCGSNRVTVAIILAGIGVIVCLVLVSGSKHHLRLRHPNFGYKILVSQWHRLAACVRIVTKLLISISAPIRRQRRERENEWMCQRLRLREFRRHIVRFGSATIHKQRMSSRLFLTHPSIAPGIISHACDWKVFAIAFT